MSGHSPAAGSLGRKNFWRKQERVPSATFGIARPVNTPACVARTDCCVRRCDMAFFSHSAPLLLSFSSIAISIQPLPQLTRSSCSFSCRLILSSNSMQQTPYSFESILLMTNSTRFHSKTEASDSPLTDSTIDRHRPRRSLTNRLRSLILSGTLTL